MRIAIVLLLVGSLGCRKAAIGVTGAATVAAVVGGGMLIDGSEDRSDERTTGVVLVTYGVLGALATMTLIATSFETKSSSTSWSPSSPSDTVSSSIPGAAPDEEHVPLGPGYAYDRTGAPAGRVDPNGHFYDRTGAPAGRADRSNGHYYDRTGAPAGRLDENGHVFDRTGAPAGRIDSNGHYYDRSGAPAGRIDENGHIYDATGAPAGRVASNCDDACRRETVGRILLR